MSGNDISTEKLNEQKLLDAIGNVDDKYVAEAEPLNKNKVSVFRIGLVAASFAVVIMCGVFIWGNGKQDESWPKVTKAPIRAPLLDDENDNDNVISDYETLHELLCYLSINEVHSDMVDVDSYNVDSSGIGEVKDFIKYKNYEYRVIDGKVNISDKNDLDAEWKKVLDCDANQISIAGDRLIVCDSYVEGEEGSETEYQKIEIYSIDNPEMPIKVCEYTQEGKKVTYYTFGSQLYVISSGGECCCEYFYEQDLERYKPKLTFAGSEVEIKDEEINILGTPTKLQHLTITKLNVLKCDKIEKKVLYGDIKRVYYDKNVILVETGGINEYDLINPKIYQFVDIGAGLEFRNVIDIAGEFEINSVQNIVENGTMNAFEILSISKNKSVYQMVIKYHLKDDDIDISYTYPAAISFDSITYRIDKALKWENKEIFESVDDITWDKNVAICCVKLKNGEAAYVKINFDTMSIHVDE